MGFMAMVGPSVIVRARIFDTNATDQETASIVVWSMTKDVYVDVIAHVPEINSTVGLRSQAVSMINDQ